MGISKFDSLDVIGMNYQRPTKYAVDLRLPSALTKNFGSLFNQSFNLMCKGIQAPQMETQTVSLGLDGRTINLPTYFKLDNSVTMTFYIDEKHTIRRALEYWMICIDSAVSAGEDSPEFGIAGSGLLGKVANAGIGIVQNALGNTLGGMLGNALGLTQSVNSEAPDITGELTLSCKNYIGADVAKYTFLNAFPTNISSYDFKDDDTSSVSEFSVTFSYTNVKYNGVKDVTSNIGSLIGL